MKGLVKYHLQQYQKTNRYVMPLAVLLIMIYGIYSVKPADFTACLSATGMFVFLVMVWVGVTTCDQEDIVSEQILILRVQSAGKYHFSHILFQIFLSLTVSLIATIVPAFQNAMNGMKLFDRPVLVTDVLGGFVLLFLCACLGSTLGEFSHPGIIKNRKTAVVFVFLLAMLSLAKGVITEPFPLMKLILWVLPPIWELTCILADQVSVSRPVFLEAGGRMLLSVTVLMMIKMYLMKKQYHKCLW